MKSTVNKKNPARLHQKYIYEMICRSNQKEISHIEEFLRRVSLQLHIDDGMMYRLLVSCTEAVNNAIIHGNKSNPDKRVIIRCIVRKNTLTIRVIDEGKGFNSRNLQDPREEKNLLKENGRGIFLMRSLMDTVTFKKLKSGSEVEMKVKLQR
jgi:serine/threonine-protein kinase RsbW